MLVLSRKKNESIVINNDITDGENGNTGYGCNGTLTWAQRWTTAYTVTSPTNPFAAPEITPAQAYTAPLVAGERVFVLAADRSLAAYDAATGQRLWRQQRQGEPLVLRQPGVLMAVGDTLELNDRRAVFIVVSGEKMSGRTAAIEQASLAMQAMELTPNKARMVLVDVADPKETAYVADLKLGALEVPTVVVFNGAGKRISTLRAPWTAAALAEAAVKEGCSCCEGGVCDHEAK